MFKEDNDLVLITEKRKYRRDISLSEAFETRHISGFGFFSNFRRIEQAVRKHTHLWSDAWSE